LSLGWAGAVKIASKWFSFRRYGAVMAIVSLSFLFGDAVARQFMALLIQYGFGWGGVFAASAALLAALFAACLFLLRESPADIGETEPSANPLNLFAAAGGQERPKNLGALLMEPERGHSQAARLFKIAACGYRRVKGNGPCRVSLNGASKVGHPSGRASDGWP
jgi:MFS family permease